MQYTPDDESSKSRVKDAELDEMAVVDIEERAKGSTWFNPEDANVGVHMSDGPNQNRWQHLRELNDGLRDTDRREENRVSERVNDTKFVGSECGLSERELDTACRLVSTVDFRFGPHANTEDVILAMIIFSSHDAQRVMNNDRFHDFIDDWNSDIDTIESVLPTLKKKVGIVEKQ